MILINYDPVTGKETRTHHRPETDLGIATQEQAEADGGVLVTSIPDPEAQVGKIPVLYVDLTTKQPYYRYEDRPPTPEDKIAQLEAKLAQVQLELTATQQATDYLLLNQMPPT